MRMYEPSYIVANDDDLCPLPRFSIPSFFVSTHFHLEKIDDKSSSISSHIHWHDVHIHFIPLDILIVGYSWVTKLKLGIFLTWPTGCQVCARRDLSKSHPSHVLSPFTLFYIGEILAFISLVFCTSTVLIPIQ